MHFDWYQATVDAHPSEVIGAVQADAGNLVGEVSQGKGRHNYQHSTALLDVEGGRILEVLHGGANGAPNFTSSGTYAEAVSESIRHRWPAHRVTRCDVADDVVGKGAFERLEEVCRSVAVRHRVKGRAIVPDDVDDGRTYYLGARSSAVRVRLYDKTAEARSKLPTSRYGEVPEHWARLEVQVRPQRAAKASVAALSPQEVWFTARWTSDLARCALSLDLERIRINDAWKPDADRALRFMVKQYGRHLERLAQSVGGWNAPLATRLHDLWSDEVGASDPIAGGKPGPDGPQ